MSETRSPSVELAKGTPRIDEFIRRFTEQRGEIYFAKTPGELVDRINSLIESRGRGSSCAPEELLIRRPGSPGESADISGQLKTTVSFADFVRNPLETARTLDVGITRSDCAIAETGSIVDVSFTDEHRLLSSISRVHITVLAASDILLKLRDLAPKLNSLLSSRNSVKKKPSVTLIGGPSRTSDIELKSVLGVHGPHEVHVVIYDESKIN